MSSRWLQALKDLAAETQRFLNHPHPDIQAWKEYGQKREALFAVLYSREARISRAEEGSVQSLLEAVLQQDRALLVRARAQQSRLQEELNALARARRALRGYAFLSPSFPGLWERRV